MLNDLLVAHRGYQKLYPENSRLALSKAIEAGAHYLETDVMFSADRQPILYHDLIMQRLSGINDGVHHKTWRELQHISAHEPERFGEEFVDNTIAPLSYLCDLLADHPNVKVFVELKPSGINHVGPEFALQACEQALSPVRDQCILMSYHYDVIVQARKDGWPQVGVVLEKWEDLHLCKLHHMQPNYVFASHLQLPKTGVIDLAPKNLAHALLVIYEVADADFAVQLFKRGVDMVETFDIAGMLQALAHKAL